MAGPFRELRHAFVSDGLAELHAFPTALTPWLDLRRKGEAGSGVSIVFPLYDEHGVWGLDTDGATLLGALGAYAQAVGTPYYRSPGRTGADLLQELGKRGADRKRAYPERLPAPAGQADTVAELSWLRTLAPAERAKAYLHSYDKNAQWLSAAGVVELGLSGIEGRRDPAGKMPFDKKLPGYWLARIAGAEERWACTPTVAWALERGQAVAISEAHVWTAHSRAMETWYERLRGARTALYADTTPAGRLALAVFKLTYAVTISSLAGQWHRPDSGTGRTVRSTGRTGGTRSWRRGRPTSRGRSGGWTRPAARPSRSTSTACTSCPTSPMPCARARRRSRWGPASAISRSTTLACPWPRCCPRSGCARRGTRGVCPRRWRWAWA